MDQLYAHPHGSCSQAKARKTKSEGRFDYLGACLGLTFAFPPRVDVRVEVRFNVDEKNRARAAVDEGLLK